MEKKSKIETLQGLRFIAFIAIFMSHLNGYMGINVVSYAYFAVSFFFVLSGFVSIITLDKNMKKLDNKNNIFIKSLCYTKNKMSKIYPLYILAIILYIPFSIKHLIIEADVNIIKYLLLVLLNVLFLQSWPRKHVTDIAHVGWYLSVLVFLNFITIIISKLIKKINKDNLVIKNIIMIIGALGLLFLYSKIVPSNYSTHYFYFFPIFRIFEYLIGMFLGNIFLKTKDYKIFSNKVIMSLLEIIVVFSVAFLISKGLGNGYGIRISIISILIDILLIYIFMYQGGSLSSLLSIKPLVFLGNISGEMYLLHSVLIAYIFGIAKRILTQNNILAMCISIFIFILTIIFAYIIHYKKYINIQKNLKTKLIHIIGTFKKKKLKCKNFTIISNNCFGGVFYRNNALEYMSPTCGMFIMPKDYIKFIYNLKEYLKLELKEIKLEESNYKEYLEEIKYPGTIGKLNDVEIMFLHYKNFDEAKQKWERRAKRVYFDNIIYKFNDQNNCTYDELLKFEQFDAKNKLCFTAKKYDNINSIIFSEFEKDGYVLNDSKEKIYKKYIDMYKYINERFGVNEKN